jgi:hypothetical protein
MFSWLKALRERWAERRAAHRAAAAERTLRRNEANALRRSHERVEGQGPNGPMGGPGV